MRLSQKSKIQLNLKNIVQVLFSIIIQEILQLLWKIPKKQREDSVKEGVSAETLSFTIIIFISQRIEAGIKR